MTAISDIRSRYSRIPLSAFRPGDPIGEAVARISGRLDAWHAWCERAERVRRERARRRAGLPRQRTGPPRWWPLQRCRRGVLWAATSPYGAALYVVTAGARPGQTERGTWGRRAALRAYAAQRLLERRYGRRFAARWEVEYVGVAERARRWQARRSGWADSYACAPTLRSLRGQLARRLRALRASPYRDPRAGARWPDGTLAGWRAWRVREDGALVSPVWGTRWDAPRCRCDAERWNDSAALRGVAGVHAYWPGVAGYLPRGLGTDVERAQQGQPVAVGLVAGWGRVVVGEDGWRAEHAAAQLIYVPSALVAAVQRAYPHLPVRCVDDLVPDIRSGRVRVSRVSGPSDRD